MNNYERIKNMSLEEMAVMLAEEIPHGDCYGCELCDYIYACQDCTAAWKRWLEEGVSNEQ